MIRNTILTIGNGILYGISISPHIMINITPYPDGSNVKNINYSLMSSSDQVLLSGDIPLDISQSITSMIDKSLIDERIWVDTPYIRLNDVLRAIYNISPQSDDELENKGLSYNIQTIYKSFEELGVNLMVADISLYLVCNYLAITKKWQIPHYADIEYLTSDILTSPYLEMLSMTFQIWSLSYDSLISLLGGIMLNFIRTNIHIFHNNCIIPPNINIYRVIVSASTTSIDKMNFLISQQTINHQESVSELNTKFDDLIQRLDRAEKLVLRLSSK